MFNIFRKKKMANDKAVEDNSDFLLKFSEEQKAAMIYSLMLLSSAKGSYDEAKLVYTENQADALKFNLESPAMINQMERKAEYAYSIIKKFNTNQKDWYSTLLGAGMYIGGNPTNDEKKIIHRILDESEISISQFNTANKKANIIINTFSK
jgi:hypothetical protein